MADTFSIKLDGVEDLKQALAEAAATIRTKAVRGALREAGKVIQMAARAAAPVLKVPTATRNVGTVQKNIVVRASKFARQAGDEGVFIGVRGIRGTARISRLGRAGAKNPNDPYYWRFLEFDRVVGGGKIKGGRARRAMVQSSRIASGSARRIPGKHFLRDSGTSQGAAAIQKFMDSVVPQIEKLNARVKSK